MVKIEFILSKNLSKLLIFLNFDPNTHLFEY